TGEVSYQTSQVERAGGVLLVDGEDALTRYGEGAELLEDRSGYDQCLWSEVDALELQCGVNQGVFPVTSGTCCKSLSESDYTGIVGDTLTGAHCGVVGGAEDNLLACSCGCSQSL